MKDMKEPTNPTGKKSKVEENILEKKILLLEKLKESKGIISYACTAAKIDRDTYYRYLNEDDEFRQEVRNIKESQIDVVEAALLSNIADKKEASIFFYLKTQAKHRGYVEKIEVDNNLGFMSLLKKASMDADENALNEDESND